METSNILFPKPNIFPQSDTNLLQNPMFNSSRRDQSNHDWIKCGERKQIEKNIDAVCITLFGLLEGIYFPLNTYWLMSRRYICGCILIKLC